MFGMASEIYCEYCRGFQPYSSGDVTMQCSGCGSVVARLNIRGQMYCDDCRAYQQPAYEELHAPLPDDHNNHGYLLGDICCSRCKGILGVVREPATVSSAV